MTTSKNREVLATNDTEGSKHITFSAISRKRFSIPASNRKQVYEGNTIKNPKLMQDSRITDCVDNLVFA